MKQKLTLLMLLFLAIAMTGLSVKADNYLRIGMEAAYAPFNWTQNDDSNGAVPIEGTNQYANGYDVQIAKKIAEAMGKEPLVVKTSWTGLIPALTSGKIDMIAAGMSPTEERKLEIAFSNAYATSEPVLVVSRDGDFAKAKSLEDFAGAKITAQQGVWHVNLLPQLVGADPQTPMGDFSQMRQALASGIIDAYVSERPEALTAEGANSKFLMVTPDPGFEVAESDAAIAVGLRKDDIETLVQVNAVLDTISEEDRVALMDKMIEIQPADDSATEEEPSFFQQVLNILTKNWKQFLRGTGVTLLISMVGTISGLIIGLLIGVYRTAPTAANKGLAILQKIFGWLLSAYIEIFRGTPMIV